MKRWFSAAALAATLSTPLATAQCAPPNPCRTLPPPTAEQARVGTPPVEVEIEVNGKDCQLVFTEDRRPYWELESETE